MSAPCSECPFLVDSPFDGSMCRERAQEIADTLLSDRWFPCHKTTGASGAQPGREAWCRGALGTMANQGIELENMSVLLSIAMGTLVTPIEGDREGLHASLSDWVAAHGRRR